MPSIIYLFYAVGIDNIMFLLNFFHKYDFCSQITLVGVTTNDVTAGCLLC